MSTGVRRMACEYAPVILPIARAVVRSVGAFGLAFSWSVAMPAVAGAWPGMQDPASPVLLTEVVSTGGDALREAAGEGDIGLLLDAPNLSANDAHAVVFAVQDAQAAGRDVIAIVESDVEDGSAVVAAACQGLVTVGSASLTGCSDAWCGSPSRREALAAQLEKSGGRDRAIAERLLGGTSALSYSPTQGAQPSVPPSGIGSIILAQQGKPMKLTAGALQTIGWTGPPQADVASAMAAIVAGQVKVPPKAPKRSAGSGSTPPPPPGGKAAPPPPPAGVLPPAAAKKLADIQRDLALLKKAIESFNKYFTAEVGVWTEKSKGLREVWKTGEMTKDQPTKKESRELQTTMRQLAESIDRNIRTIKAAAKGAPVPQQSQLTELSDLLRTFKASLETDDPDKYSQSSAKVTATKLK